MLMTKETRIQGREREEFKQVGQQQSSKPTITMSVDKKATKDARSCMKCCQLGNRPDNRQEC